MFHSTISILAFDAFGVCVCVCAWKQTKIYKISSNKIRTFSLFPSRSFTSLAFWYNSNASKRPYNRRRERERRNERVFAGQKQKQKLYEIEIKMWDKANVVRVINWAKYQYFIKSCKRWRNCEIQQTSICCSFLFSYIVHWPNRDDIRMKTHFSRVINGKMLNTAIFSKPIKSRQIHK